MRYSLLLKEQQVVFLLKSTLIWIYKCWLRKRDVSLLFPMHRPSPQELNIWGRAVELSCQLWQHRTTGELCSRIPTEQGWSRNCTLVTQFLSSHVSSSSFTYKLLSTRVVFLRCCASGGAWICSAWVGNMQTGWSAALSTGTSQGCKLPLSLGWSWEETPVFLDP